MARINTNVPSVIAQGNLRRSDGDLQLRLERLSTGLRINRGKDDPAGLIISDRIGTDLTGIEAALKNGDRASAVIATTEAALAEINSLLNSVKSLLVEAANTGANSVEERDANQLQIDSAIQSITRISNTASFGGLRLLDGSLDYVTSGITASTISKAQIFSASFIGQTSLSVEVNVVASAQTGGLYLNGAAPANSVWGDGALQSSLTIAVTGNRGVQELTFTSGTSLSDVAQAVNQLTSLTGVRAELINNNANSGLVFRSEFNGSTEFVSVRRVGGPSNPADDSFQLYKFANNAAVPGSGTTFPWGGADLTLGTRDEGRDVSALVNGNLASGRGLRVTVNSTSLGAELLLGETFATDPTLSAATFEITGGGSLFQLGPEINALQQSNIGIPSMAATNLGGTLVDGSLQFLSSLAFGQANSIEASVARGDFTAASDIIDNAIDEVAILRGRLGAFERNTLETNQRSLQAAFENLTASRSIIRDADFAAETSALTRAQILQSSGTTVLTLANSQAQNVLQLLG